MLIDLQVNILSLSNGMRKRFDDATSLIDRVPGDGPDIGNIFIYRSRRGRKTPSLTK